MVEHFDAITTKIDDATKAALQQKLSTKDNLDSFTLPAKLVILLLRINTEASLAIVKGMGHKITVCPSYLARMVLPAPVKTVGTTKRTKDQRRVIKIAPRSQWAQPDGGRTLDKCDLYRRLGILKPGQTLEQAFAQGVTRRDIRIAQRKGWIEIEEDA